MTRKPQKSPSIHEFIKAKREQKGGSDEIIDFIESLISVTKKQITDLKKLKKE